MRAGASPGEETSLPLSVSRVRAMMQRASSATQRRLGDWLGDPGEPSDDSAIGRATRASELSDGSDDGRQRARASDWLARTSDVSKD